MRISDWSSDVCSSDLQTRNAKAGRQAAMGHFFMRMAFYFTARAFHHMDGIGGAGIEQDHTEFIAAQSAQNISMPDRSLHIFRKIGRASCRERVCQYV